MSTPLTCVRCMASGNARGISRLLRAGRRRLSKHIIATTCFKSSSLPEAYLRPVGSVRMSKRSYAQLCPIAHALDLVGERWTLLVVRELLLGPKRFSDLHAGLPGIGTNILSARLKELEDASVVSRR